MATKMMNDTICDPKLLGRLRTRIERYRRKHKMTQEELAGYLGMRVGTLVTYLNGRRMKRIDRGKYDRLMEMTAPNGTRAKPAQESVLSD